jgi:endogenous inhibitor of DNA gyrase (YacG/DUF329 family)
VSASGTAKPRIVRCPTCGTQVAWIPENAFRPFCAERCRLIDLGAWAEEKYRVPEPQSEGEEAPDPPHQ